jgi:hypothetical protein
MLDSARTGDDLDATGASKGGGAAAKDGAAAEEKPFGAQASFEVRTSL